MRPFVLKGFVLSFALFTPAAVWLLHADLREELVEHIAKAQSSVDVVVYEIRSNDIADALVTAKRRGVRVRVIVDSVRSPVATSQEKTLEEEGIPVKRIDGTSRKLLHDKFILIDGSMASTPSYNRSAGSLRKEGSEQSFITDKNLIDKLKGEFADFWTSSGQNETE